ncbi:rod shape-determining protein MreD [Zavarzinia compransoris]|uniref:rod shape-determining protein MreD n=1 Tax=Zavarzinia marina TaxID=2911065 RepID=UPI001F38DAE1|nr:rod shape-determining protein MreD [Zavarzinia marina]MCF4167479.1 rod shape-determining protein MreD [Zavarzinia marina]
MTESWPRRLLANLVLLVPPLVGLLCVLVGVAPSGISAIDAAGPALTLMLVYFWTIFQPALLPPPAVFIIGLLQDTLSGAPIGLGTLILLGVQQFVAHERRVFTARTFTIAWLGFGMVAVLATAAGWLLGSIHAGLLLEVRPFLGQVLLSVTLYPVVSWLFGQIVRGLKSLEAFR